jgi:acyl-CoA reductase-like NAD-dependent aldehyde dehydrogenase
VPALCHQQVYRAFLDRFTARAGSPRIGDGSHPKTDMGPLVSESQLHNVMHYVTIGKEEGARLACGGNRVAIGDLAKGWFHEPTIFADVDPRMRIAQEEIFGPVVSVLSCRNLDEAIEIGNGVAYGLSSAIYTQDVNKAFRAMRDLCTGNCYVNASTIGAEVHLPFGGVKQTGNGHREAGQQALDFFSEWKSIYIDFSGKLQRAQIDNN